MRKQGSGSYQFAADPFSFHALDDESQHFEVSGSFTRLRKLTTLIENVKLFSHGFGQGTSLPQLIPKLVAKYFCLDRSSANSSFAVHPLTGYHNLAIREVLKEKAKQRSD